MGQTVVIAIVLASQRRGALEGTGVLTSMRQNMTSLCTPTGMRARSAVVSPRG
jgi:hypothetical protein